MKLKLLTLVMTLGLTTFIAEAQTPTNEENTTTKLQKVKEFCDKHLNLSGYLQTGFEWNEIGGSSFYVKRARLTLTGDLLKEKFDYRLQVDMAGSPRITDFYIRFKPLNQINVELGQFKVPFAVENDTYGPTTFEFIEYSYLTTYLVRNNALYDGVAATGRDIGLQLYGSFFERDGYSILNYNLAVLNGSGINVKDNNKSKDFVARLIVKPIKGLSISGSYLFGESRFDNNNYMNSSRWSVGAVYDVRHWIARTEFAQADFGGNRTDAFYILGGYHFDKPWSVVARYEFINDEAKILSEDRITLGGVYKPFNFLRLQLNLSYTMYNQTPHQPKQNSLGFGLMATAMF